MYFFCFLRVDEPINGIGGWGLIISRRGAIIGSLRYCNLSDRLS